MTNVNKRYNNYHKHTDYSNIRTPDVIAKPQDYIDRAKELGHTTYFTTEHGCSGNVFEAYDLCKENDLKCIFGMEMYYADDRHVKEGRKNYHIMVVGLTKNAYKHINRISSEANKTGFYYHPRVDMELLLTLPADETIITTACIGGRLFKDGDYINEFVLPLKNHFGDNFMLETQAHSHEAQAEWNRKVLLLSDEYDIPIIHGNDSHYIYPEDAELRSLFLKGKGMRYGDEDSFILDYPTYDVIIDRYKEQGILNDKQIEESLHNTLIFDKAEDLKFNKEIKMPTIYKEKNKANVLKKIIAQKWKEESKNIPKERHSEYEREIMFEMDIVEETEMSDYFLLNERIIDKSVNEYNAVLTRTGRGCFTEDSLVHTETEIKSIKDVKIGDKVITESGVFNKVLNTMSYDIEEDLVQIKHIYGTDKYYPTICTLDHKILINRDNEIGWVEAGDIMQGDFVCTPKIKIENRLDSVIDLNDYNDFGYEYDDEYIYEMSSMFNDYIKYNPTEISTKIGVGKSLFERYANGDDVPFTRKPWALEKFFEYTPFKDQEEYVRYMKKSRTRKINRFINLDEEFNIFIGLMYGDGSSPKNRPYTIGLATHSEEDIVNKEVFYNIASRINIPVVENQSKNKKLLQLFMNCNTFSNFIRKELFVSEKGTDKVFNSKWMYQCRENLDGLIYGLRLADGSFKETRIAFDNTSSSIANAYKLLCLMTGEGVNSLAVRKAHTMKNGYKCKESYKLRINPNALNNPKRKERIKEDDKYWYLPIVETNILKNQKTTVYDIEVENEHSYLLNNMIVHNSAPSFYINKLLGFTDIDRIAAPVPLYSTRFMSKSRILETKSLADIDFNFSDVEPAIRASKDLLGEDGVYYMIAYGTMQESGAFRNLCRAHKDDLEHSKEKNEDGVVINNDFNKKIDEEIKMFNLQYNDVAKDLDSYRDDENWKDMIETSKNFIGVIDSVAPSPCSFLLLNEPISEEIGLIKVGDEICCSIDGYTADKWKFLKNDLLTVGVWTIISKTFNMIKKPIPTIEELNELIDHKVWDLYANGITSTMNQVDSDFATGLVKKYKPTSIAELSAFVAAIRPGFSSLLNHFLNREEYSTGVDELDEVLQDSFHYLLYQESIMQFLVWCGIHEDETYGILKQIAKKHFEDDDLAILKEKLIKGFEKNTGSTEGFDGVWQVIEDAVDYAFNASHSLSVAYDSLYGAYLKANYPLEYYTVVFNHYKNDIERTNKLVEELPYFGITLNPIKFGYSGAEYRYDRDTNSIYKGVESIKYLNEEASNDLLELGKDKTYNNLYTLFDDIHSKTGINSRQLDILIKLNYFDKYGKNKKILDFKDIFKEIYGKKQFSKAKVSKLGLSHAVFTKYSRQTEKTYMEIDVENILKELLLKIEDLPLSLKDQISTEIEYLNHIEFTEPKASEDFYIVTDFRTFKNKNRPYITLYQLKTGKTKKTKVTDARFYANNKFKLLDTIQVKEFDKQFKNVMVNNKWTKSDEVEEVLTSWNVF